MDEHAVRILEALYRSGYGVHPDGSFTVTIEEPDGTKLVYRRTGEHRWTCNMPVTENTTFSVSLDYVPDDTP